MHILYFQFVYAQLLGSFYVLLYYLMKSIICYSKFLIKLYEDVGTHLIIEDNLATLVTQIHVTNKYYVSFSVRFISTHGGHLHHNWGSEKKQLFLLSEQHVSLHVVTFVPTVEGRRRSVSVLYAMSSAQMLQCHDL